MYSLCVDVLNWSSIAGRIHTWQRFEVLCGSSSWKVPKDTCCCGKVLYIMWRYSIQWESCTVLFGDVLLGWSSVLGDFYIERVCWCIKGCHWRNLLAFVAVIFTSSMTALLQHSISFVFFDTTKDRADTKVDINTSGTSYRLL